MNDKYIYLDYAANTPVDKAVLEKFNEITLKYYGNPNSTHDLGKITNKKINESTENILKLLQKKTNIDIDKEIKENEKIKKEENENINSFLKL